MTTATRRGPGRPGYDLDTLLAAAAAAFTERGFDGTSMDDLAKRLGLSKSAIYHHVASKDALLGLALDRALDGLGEVAANVRMLDAPAVVRLETLLHDSVLVLCRELPYVTLLVRLHGNSPVERRALQRRRTFDNLGAELVKQAVDDGDLRPDLDPRLTARLLFGQVNSLVEWYRPKRGHSAEVLARAVVENAFQGLRSISPMMRTAMPR